MSFQRLLAARPARQPLRHRLRLAVAATLCASLAVLVEPSAAATPEAFSCRDLPRLRSTPQVLVTVLAGTPAIVRAPPVIRRPPIVLWHGYGAPGSEAELMQALPLDDVPALKVYLGLPLFGARAPGPGAPSVAARQQADFAGQLFAPAVLGAADELPAVTAALRAAGCLAPHEEIGIFGFSAGGTAALAALADRRTPIGVAVAINAPVGLTPTVEALQRATGKPFDWTPAARALAARADAIPRAGALAPVRPPPALLLLHGADDAVVGPGGAHDLAAALAPFYRRSGHTERLRVEVVPAVPHDWSASPQLAELRRTVADWFNRFLPAGAAAQRGWRGADAAPHHSVDSENLIVRGRPSARNRPPVEAQ